MKYVCELCGKIYDEQLGDPAQKIAPGTPFDQLPEQYCCAYCGSEKEAFCPAGGSAAAVRPAQPAYIKYLEEHKGESQR